MSSAAPLRNAVLVDSSVIHDAKEHFAQLWNVSRTRIDFYQLHDVLREMQASAGWGLSKSLLLCAIDERSAASRNFVEAVEKTPFEVEPVDYRDLYVSLPPGVRPSRPEEGDETRRQKPLSSMVPRITYILGRMSRHPDPQVLVVSHCFEIKWALETLKRQCPAARVGMAFFRDLWDFRLKDFDGNLKGDTPVEFFELDGYIDRLFGIKPDAGARSFTGRKESPIDKF